MPELPEVETIRLGLLPYLQNNIITQLKIYENRLRWPIEKELQQCVGKSIQQLSRRGKYLILKLNQGNILLHLGMSGRLHLLDENSPRKKHDHVDFILQDHKILRFHDPRRFGAILWTNKEDFLQSHPLLKNLGPEPLEVWTLENWLKQANKARPIKSILMDAKVVVGIGNIYANEALFKAKIHPERLGNTISRNKLVKLQICAQETLKEAIICGGTTLKDFQNVEGKPGYFQQHLWVYGRGHKPCLICKTFLKEIRLNNRSTVFCPRCQL